MGNFFRPADPKYQRTVMLSSVIVCSVVAVHTVMMDHGSQDHVFTPLQKYINSRVDSYFEITEEELKKPSTADSRIPITLKNCDGTTTRNGRAGASLGIISDKTKNSDSSKSSSSSGSGSNGNIK